MSTTYKLFLILAGAIVLIEGVPYGMRINISTVALQTSKITARMLVVKISKGPFQSKTLH